MIDPEERALRREEIASLASEALALIDADAPDYAVALHALRALPREDLEAEHALLEPLFVELRKLRPFPLWVRDTPARALTLKRVAKLDGAIGVGGPPGDAEGRECWLEVAAELAESTLRALPPGWALLVRGERAPWALLRRVSPLRALGVALDGEPVPHGPHPLLSDTRLDLITLDPGRVDDAGLGARVLWSLESPDLRDLAAQALALTAQVPYSGLVCDGDDALSCALWFATVRRRPH